VETGYVADDLGMTNVGFDMGAVMRKGDQADRVDWMDKGGSGVCCEYLVTVPRLRPIALFRNRTTISDPQRRHALPWTHTDTQQSETQQPQTTSLQTSPNEPVNPSSLPIAPRSTNAPPQIPVDNTLPPLSVRILCTDVTKHLDGVHRQKGGIGNQGYDEKQKDLRAFFGGGGGATE
jgi:hypothetical protein